MYIPITNNTIRTRASYLILMLIHIQKIEHEWGGAARAEHYRFDNNFSEKRQFWQATRIWRWKEENVVVSKWFARGSIWCDDIKFDYAHTICAVMVRCALFAAATLINESDIFYTIRNALMNKMIRNHFFLWWRRFWYFVIWLITYYM